MELRCAAWLVNHEGWIFLWMGGGRGAIYDWNPVIMAIWVDSQCAGTVLNMNFSLSLLAKDWRSFHLRTYCLFYSFILKVKSMRTTFWPLIFILLLNLNQRVGASTCSCSTGCWLQDPSNYDMWRPSHQDEMLAVNIPANHRYIHICTCHRPLNIFTYHVHVACLRPDLYI